MKTLSQEDLQQSVDLVRSQGRPVDRAWMEFHLFDGPPAAVVEALAEYRNDDGGYGHGLEPDFRLPLSSPMATSVAFQFLVEVGAGGHDPLVAGGIDYFVNTYSHDYRGWIPVPSQVDEHPHAPWWSYQDPEKTLQEHWGNPSAEIVGYLQHYSPPADREFAVARLDEVYAHLRSPDRMEAHELICYCRLARLLDADGRQRVLNHVRPRLLEVVPSTSDMWQSYGPQPVWYVRGPDDPLAEIFDKSLDDNLDYLIESRHSDGRWEPNWQWREHLDVWQRARAEWTGHITARNLILLDAFGRIDGR